MEPARTMAPISSTVSRPAAMQMNRVTSRDVAICCRNVYRSTT